MKHQHEYIEDKNHYRCKHCDKTKLILKSINDEVKQGIKKDGKKYSVRNDRTRYFFPYEWNKFYNSLKNEKHKMLFLTLIHTGARIMEALHLRPLDINFERETITLSVTKHRTAKKNIYGIGKKRTFFVSKKYLKEIKKFIKKNNVADKDYLFLNNDELPANYEELSNKDKKIYFKKKSVSYRELLKRKLKKINIKDFYNISLHNIRKTYGNSMRTFNIEMAELCYRMGHDMDTYLSHYGSSLIFTPSERLEIIKILGDVK